MIKQVPGTYSERKLSDSDQTLDREGAEAVIDEINERAVEGHCISRSRTTGPPRPHRARSALTHQPHPNLTAQNS